MLPFIPHNIVPWQSKIFHLSVDQRMGTRCTGDTLEWKDCIPHPQLVTICLSIHSLLVEASPRTDPVLTSPGSGCAGPTLRCCHHCSKRSRPWSRGWWPGRSRQGLRMSALPLCEELELPSPRWTEYWLPLLLWEYSHQVVIYRNGCSYLYSVK